MSVRSIVRIDEARCNGCGLCIPNCAEGALTLVDGKARLVKESYCDGLGACLGTCPQDAISVEQREADDFDDLAVVAARGVGARRHAALASGGKAHEAPASPCATGPAAPRGGGCLGMRVMEFAAAPSAVEAGPATTGGGRAKTAAGSLGHWPVQLSLLPLEAPFFQDRELVIAADCTAFAAPLLLGELLGGRAVAVGCPKLDDAAAYADKLTEILRRNAVRGLVLVHMEVPCCGGIVALAREAARRSGRTLPVRDIMVGCRGEVLRDTLGILCDAQSPGADTGAATNRNTI
ncbi:MAG: ferredoxin [Planctomycetes bacterium]|nr:ferredoxin [Planctomycetota bacterium]